MIIVEVDNTLQENIKIDQIRKKIILKWFYIYISLAILIASPGLLTSGSNILWSIIPELFKSSILLCPFMYLAFLYFESLPKYKNVSDAYINSLWQKENDTWKYSSDTKLFNWDLEIISKWRYNNFLKESQSLLGRKNRPESINQIRDGIEKYINNKFNVNDSGKTKKSISIRQNDLKTVWCEIRTIQRKWKNRKVPLEHFYLLKISAENDILSGNNIYVKPVNSRKIKQELNVSKLLMRIVSTLFLLTIMWMIILIGFSMFVFNVYGKAAANLNQQEWIEITVAVLVIFTIIWILYKWDKSRWRIKNHTEDSISDDFNSEKFEYYSDSDDSIGISDNIRWKYIENIMRQDELNNTEFLFTHDAIYVKLYLQSYFDINHKMKGLLSRDNRNKRYLTNIENIENDIKYIQRTIYIITK